MRAANPVENSGNAEVVHFDRSARQHKPSPVYASRRGADDDAADALALDIDVRSASTQIYQWVVIFAVLGMAIGGAKWWSARQGAAIAELAAASSIPTGSPRSGKGAATPELPANADAGRTLDAGALAFDATAPAPAIPAAGANEAPAAETGSSGGEAVSPDVADQPSAPAATDVRDARTVRAPADVPYPRRIEGIDPDVPATAAVRRGIAVLSVLIDVRGNVVEAQLLRNLDPALDDAALTAARQWKFEPTVHDGRPVAVRSNFTVRFGY